MTLHVHLSNPPKEEAFAILESQLAETIRLTSGEIPEQAQYEILIAGRPTREELQASSHLRTVLIPFAGIPPITSEIMREFPDIAVHNLHHNAPPTAEMALALLFAAAKRLIPSDREFRQNNWIARYAPYPSILLDGKTAVILGYGAVGQQIGMVLKALGMKVLGTRRRHTDEANGIYPPETLHDLLPNADVLVIALPATDETSHLIGERELALLPKNAILVNIGRAAIVEEQALFEALHSGHLHGAGLDVWYHYPSDEASRQNTPPASLPFHELDNVVMSPHRAGGGGNLEIEALRMHAIADCLNAAANGENLPNRVDLKLGY